MSKYRTMLMDVNRTVFFVITQNIIPALRPTGVDDGYTHITIFKNAGLLRCTAYTLTYFIIVILEGREIAPNNCTMSWIGLLKPHTAWLTSSLSSILSSIHAPMNDSNSLLSVGVCEIGHKSVYHGADEISAPESHYSLFP